MTNLSALKKQSKNLLSDIKKQKEEENARRTEQNNDDRIWTPFFDKEKPSSYAKVRFLMPPNPENPPYEVLYSHAFSKKHGDKKKWYIQNSLSTLKQKCPVGEMNARLWNSGVESDKDVAKSHKRKVNHYANVLIVDDPHRPELNGTVKIFRYGVMIHKIVESAMFPEFETDEPINPFDAWDGAIFEIRMVGKQFNGNIVPNYEKSFFHKPESLGTDEEIEEIHSRTYDLKEFVDPSNFKTYDELKNMLFDVLGPTVGSGVEVVEGWNSIPEKQSSTVKGKDDNPDSSSLSEEKKDSGGVDFDKIRKTKVESTDVTSEPSIEDDQNTTDSSDDDDMNFFENL